MSNEYSIAVIVNAIRNLENNVFYTDPTTRKDVSLPIENSLRLDMLSKDGSSKTEIENIKSSITTLDNRVTNLEQSETGQTTVLADLATQIIAGTTDQTQLEALRDTSIITIDTTVDPTELKTIQDVLQYIYNTINKYADQGGNLIDTSTTTTSITDIQTVGGVLQYLSNLENKLQTIQGEPTSSTTIIDTTTTTTTKDYTTVIKSLQSIYDYVKILGDRLDSQNIIKVQTGELRTYDTVTNSLQSIYDHSLIIGERQPDATGNDIIKTTTSDAGKYVTTSDAIKDLYEKVTMNEGTIEVVKSISIFGDEE